MSSLKSRIAFAEFIDSVRHEADALGAAQDQDIWYRGQSNADYKLEPSLFRRSVVKEVAGADEVARSEHLLRLESDLFFEFQAQAMRLSDDDVSSWDLLFLMRHYGLPTRTLDWSEILGVAVYFAMNLEETDDPPSPTIWLLNPGTLNARGCGCGDSIVPRYLGNHLWGRTDADREWCRQQSQVFGRSIHDADYADVLAAWLHGEIRIKTPLAVYPSRRNDRMLAQQGSFTMHCASRDPLEVLCPAAVKKVRMPREAIAGARLFLEESGTNPRVIFPGLDGLSREMRIKYGR